MKINKTFSAEKRTIKCLAQVALPVPEILKAIQVKISSSSQQEGWKDDIVCLGTAYNKFSSSPR